MYLELMYHSIKQYESSPDTTLAGLGQITKLNADIYTLQQWARRSIATADKIRYTVNFLKSRMAKGDDMEHSALLMEDYKYIALSIDTYGRRLEALVSIATSIIQTIDCRWSLIETRDISRLTYLALSFLPLTLVSGLFSMNDTIAPGGRTFWLYFAVSIPLCIITFLIVHLSSSTPGLLARRIWRSRAVQMFVV